MTSGPELALERQVADAKKLLGGVFTLSKCEEMLEISIGRAAAAAGIVGLVQPPRKIEGRASTYILRVRLNEKCFDMYPNTQLQDVLLSGRKLDINKETEVGLRNLRMIIHQTDSVIHGEIIDPVFDMMVEELKRMAEGGSEGSEGFMEFFKDGRVLKDLKKYVLPFTYRTRNQEDNPSMVTLEVAQ